MKTQDYSNVIYINEDINKILEHKDICIKNAKAFIRKNKGYMYIHDISMFEDTNTYILLFKIIKRNSKAINEYNELKVSFNLIDHINKNIPA